MDPLTILTVVNGSIKLVEQLLPVINGMASRGEISAEQQAELRAKYESLKAKADGQFQGDHWQIDPEP
jgi:hypothetical protein